MWLRTYLYGHQALYIPSKTIKGDYEYEHLNTLITSMFDTLDKTDGLSLSAIQVGYPLQLFVIKAHILDEDINVMEEFINPQIKKTYGEEVNLYEGCISVPGCIAKVRRKEGVVLEYFNKNWDKKKLDTKGQLARLILHEMDHLNGEIYVDKLNALWKATLEVNLTNIKNRNIGSDISSYI